MSFAPSFLAIDWGTTNRRIYVIERGAVVRTDRDDRGVTAVEPGRFEAEAAAIRAAFGDLPMLMAGMVGSTVGWRVAPYVEAPAGLDALAANLCRIDDRTAIVPGLSLIDGGRADVMRGEEVQLLGAGLDGLFCQPGTHCKWAEIERGEVARFTTAMTGELFALLKRNSLLADRLGGDVEPGAAFREGVEDGKRRDLAAALFGIRAAGLLGLRDDRDAAAYASGLLIGSDVAVRVEASPHDTVHVLADAALGGLYCAALEANGRAARLLDSHAAFVSGIIGIAELAR